MGEVWSVFPSHIKSDSVRNLRAQTRGLPLPCRQKRSRVTPHEPLKDGVRVVNFSLPVFANVDLIHLPVHDALANRFHVGFVCFIGMRHRFSVRLRCGTSTVEPSHAGSSADAHHVSLWPNTPVVSPDGRRPSPVNQPKHGEYRSLARRVLEAKRLGPLDEVVGQRS